MMLEMAEVTLIADGRGAGVTEGKTGLKVRCCTNGKDRVNLPPLVMGATPEEAEPTADEAEALTEEMTEEMELAMPVAGGAWMRWSVT